MLKPSLWHPALILLFLVYRFSLCLQPFLTSDIVAMMA
jgi:hypothetical protein